MNIYIIFCRNIFLRGRKYRERKKMGLSENSKGLILAVASSAFIGSSFILKKKGLKRAGASGTRAGTVQFQIFFSFYEFFFNLWLILLSAIITWNLGIFLFLSLIQFIMAWCNGCQGKNRHKMIEVIEYWVIYLITTLIQSGDNEEDKIVPNINITKSVLLIDDRSHMKDTEVLNSWKLLSLDVCLSLNVLWKKVFILMSNRGLESLF